MKKPRTRAVFPLIRQANMMECGTTCLAMIFKFYGLFNIRGLLNRMAEVSTQGTSFYMLSQLAKTFGFKANGYKVKYKNLLDVQLPCIAHYEGNHFVVIYKATEKYLKVADPAIGKIKITCEEFCQRWNGIILVLEPTEKVFQNPDAMEMVAHYRQERKNLVKHYYSSLFTSFKGVLSEIALASFILQFLGLMLPFFTQIIVDKVLVHQNKQLLFIILAGMVVIFITQILLLHTRNVLLTQFKIRFEADFFGNFFEHFLHLKQQYFDMHKREELINRFKENIYIRRMFSPSVLQTIIEFVLFFLYFGVLYLYSVKLTLLAMFFVAIYVGTAMRYTPKLVALSGKVFTENGKAMGDILDNLLGIQNIKLLGIENQRYWDWQHRYKILLNLVQENELLKVNLTTILRAIYFLSQACVYWVGAYITFEGEITIGQYIAFITIFMLIINSMNNISAFWFMMTELSVTFERLNDVLAEETENHDVIDQQMSLAHPTLELRNITFRYPGQTTGKPILKELDLTIRKGEFLGIVGRNGCGKSTLVKLLAKLYENYSGEILADGTPITEIHPKIYRETVNMVPQEVHLFNATIKENILYGNPNATIEQVIEASKFAGLHDFVKDNYLGYNLKIGESGTNLSGGIRLRIGIARLYLSDPDVIILDEASSALDVESEKMIMDNILTHFKGKTIISIAHRLSTLKNADRIAVIDGGKVAEIGQHQELMEKEGLYAQFMKTYLNF